MKTFDPNTEQGSPSDAALDALLRDFREATVRVAHREQAVAAAALELREAAAMRADVRLRWQLPAMAALVLMLAGGSWGAWWYTHPAPEAEHAHVHAAPPQPLVTAASTAPAAVSDEALLSEVASDLSDRVPQALEPLAVSYTTNTHARSGQEEMQ